jgi:hypothetical protein
MHCGAVIAGLASFGADADVSNIIADGAIDGGGCGDKPVSCESPPHPQQFWSQGLELRPAGSNSLASDMQARGGTVPDFVTT